MDADESGAPPKSNGTDKLLNNEESQSYIFDFESCNDNWYFMPDSILLSIFSLLTPKEVVNAGLVCKHWYRVSQDELLWKELFYRTYKIDPSVGIMPGNYIFFL